MMLPTATILFLLLPEFVSSSTSPIFSSFQYQGFQGAKNISLNGSAHISSNDGGALQLCNATGERGESRAFYSSPIRFRSPYTSSVNSFSITFVFSIRTGNLLFVVAPTPNVKPFDNVFRIEIETSNNYVGFQINDTISESPRAAGYRRNGSFVNLSIGSGNRTELRLVYNSSYRQTRVYLTPFDRSFVSPLVPPLFSVWHDLSDIFIEDMYMGFAANCLQGQKLLLSWNFKIENPNPYPWYLHSQTPSRRDPPSIPEYLALALFYAFTGALLTTFVVVFVCCIACCIRRKKKFLELIEDWEGELNYISHRFKYKDLYMATKGFNDTEVLGRGGFGKVYRGVMPHSNVEIALKKISHDSSQGMKEFVAEIVTLGRLRHRNLVPLLGYCRQKGELFLVYEYMPNGSLDKFLHSCEFTRSVGLKDSKSLKVWLVGYFTCTKNGKKL